MVSSPSLQSDRRCYRSECFQDCLDSEPESAKDFPRFLVVKIQTANPFYDDSYAVDSANLGPYGEAIETELLPAVEKQFRAIGQSWARFVYGGSTGGWEGSAGLLP
jgi:hypothetical protein